MPGYQKVKVVLMTIAQVTLAIGVTLSMPTVKDMRRAFNPAHSGSYLF
jgi:hypothetical protein